ncbi:MAG TPA: tetratricopeptide repeat protein, partial [Thiolinea sp.]|nr:tetratricopeptide repeat protein [Thiolinea sp.]
MHSIKASEAPELGSLYNPADQFKTAISLIEGQNTKADFSTGLKWLKLAAAQQYPQALYQLGFYYEYGIDEVQRDYFKAVELYEKAAKQGHLESQFNLSALLLRENTPVYNLKQGTYWLEQAAKQNDSEAQYSLAMLLEKKTDGRSLTWLTKAAHNGHRTAQYILGVKYLQGEGVKPDAEQAFTWFQKAAQQGDAAAQFNTGLMYEQGTGVKQDLKLAIDWYQKAAAQDEAGAQFNLGNKYLFGSGIKQDTNTGIALIQAAAKSGNPAAQTLLGNMLSTGK